MEWTAKIYGILDMTKEVSQIVGEIVSKIDNTVEGIYEASTGRTLICDTKWLRVGKTISNEADDMYMVTKVEDDEWIEVKPMQVGAPDLEGTIYLPVPFYITGTRLATNREWTLSTSKMMDKTPISWLLEIIRVSKKGRESTIDFDSELRLFFLDETDIRNYYTADHRDNVVYPMQRLAEAFIEVVRYDRSFETIFEYDLITFSRFGVEGTEGMFENILDANLSGVELRVTLAKYKANCKC